MLDESKIIIDDQLFLDEEYVSSNIPFGAVVRIDVQRLMVPINQEILNRRLEAATYLAEVAAKTCFVLPDMVQLAYGSYDRDLKILGVIDHVRTLQTEESRRPEVDAIFMSDAEIGSNDFKLSREERLAVAVEDIKQLKLTKQTID